MSRIYILHENDSWTAPLIAALERHGLPWESWHLADGWLDPQGEPPQGVFYNRMSGPAHTRGHRFAPELTGHILDWLEAHERRVVNKLAQYMDRLARFLAEELARIGG